MSNIMFDDAAKRIQAQWLSERARIEADRELSPEGKGKRLAAAEQVRRAAVAKLQAEYQIDQAADRRDLEHRAAEARKAEAVRRRKILGDSIYADVQRRRLERMDPAQIVAEVQAAPTDFDRALLEELGDLELAGRPETFAVYTARQDIRPAGAKELRAIEAEIAQIDTGGDVDRLDLDALAQRQSAVLGVGLEAMRTALAE